MWLGQDSYRHIYFMNYQCNRIYIEHIPCSKQMQIRIGGTLFIFFTGNEVGIDWDPFECSRKTLFSCGGEKMLRSVKRPGCLMHLQCLFMTFCLFFSWGHTVGFRFFNEKKKKFSILNSTCRVWTLSGWVKAEWTLLWFPDFPWTPNSFFLVMISGQTSCNCKDNLMRTLRRAKGQEHWYGIVFMMTMGSKNSLKFILS